MPEEAMSKEDFYKERAEHHANKRMMDGIEDLKEEICEGKKEGDGMSNIPIMGAASLAGGINGAWGGCWPGAFQESISSINGRENFMHMLFNSHGFHAAELHRMEDHLGCKVEKLEARVDRFHEDAKDKFCAILREMEKQRNECLAQENLLLKAQLFSLQQGAGAATAAATAAAAAAG